MKKLFFTPLFFVCTLLLHAQKNEATEKYIQTYYELAIREMIRTGVPASITLAQGVLESASGSSRLAVNANNHFGIKCKEEWTGDKAYENDDRRHECFRSYTNAEESFTDHSDFLKSRPYYTSLFDLDPNDYEAWAYGLKKAGYATSPSYAAKLIKIINDYHLQQYTDVALNRKAGLSNELAMIHADQQQPLAQTAAYNNEENETTDTEAEIKKILMEESFPAGVFRINTTKVMYVKAGSSMFALAAANNIAYKKVLEYNDLTDEDILTEDRLIFLERKPKTSPKEFHTMQPGETIEVIAQTEGVQLQSLRDYNKLGFGMQPAPGEKVYLRPGNTGVPRLSKR